MKQPKSKRLRFIPLTTEQLGALIDQPDTDERTNKVLSKMYKGCVKHPEAWIWYTRWKILLSADNTCIGSLNFSGTPENGAVEIVYEVDGLYQKRGYATEAVKAAVKWVFSQRGVYFVVAETGRENAASIKVLRNNHFVLLNSSKDSARWSKEKPSRSLMMYAMCVGVTLGAVIGSMLGQLVTGLLVGLGLGASIGLARDGQDKSLRVKFKDQLK